MSKQQARPYKAIALLSQPEARLICSGEESFILSGKRSARINQVTYKLLLENGWIAVKVLDPSGLCSATLTRTGREVAARIAANAGRFKQLYAPWAETDNTAEEEALAALVDAGKSVDLPPEEESAERATASEELQQRPQWVNWTAEPRRDGGAKPPYQTGSDSRASTSDPATWGTCQEARKAVESGQHTGIGYVFSEDDPYTGIDLDKCRHPETGVIRPWALRIIARFNSYTEVSPSGTGVHIYVKGRLPGAARRRDQVEAYSSGQYFTWTGEHLRDTPTTIEPGQGQLDELYQWLSRPTATARKEPPRPAAENTKKSTVGGYGARERYRRPANDDEVLAMARNARNKAEFCQLYDQGDTNGYASHSHADWRLCQYLKYWTHGDADQMDRLFRRSALMSDKWDRSAGQGLTYGQLTLSKVLALSHAASQERSR
jgi:hypothetical protein